MKRDAGESLITLIEVVYWAGLTVVMFRLSEGYEVPLWVWPIGFVLISAILGRRIIQRFREKRLSENETAVNHRH